MTRSPPRQEIRITALPDGVRRSQARGLADPKQKPKMIVGLLLVIGVLVLLQWLGHHPLIVATALCLILVIVILPLLEARLIRADELLADQVAVDLGYGGSLRRYLSLLQEPTHSRWHWHKRLMATHPPLAHRIALLPPDNAVNGQR